MTDTQTGAPVIADGQPNLRIVAQFVRDLSFENPRAPESLRAGVAQPQIDMNVEMSARSREDGLYEVDLTLSARATRGEEPVFHVEVVYGGLFQVEGVPVEEIEPILLVECPRFLFPFARRLIADVSGDGGFPPFLIDPIDFGAVYAARKVEAGMPPAAGNA
jgi:preprotein translocase subunit SecB